MKTSTILLLATASLLVVVPVLYAVKLNGMIERGEYTLYSEVQREPGQMIDIQSFKHIEFRTANNVFIEIVQSDTVSLEKDKELELRIKQRGDTLFIEQKEEAMDFNQPTRLVRIQTPNLLKADITGIEVSETTGTGNVQEIRRYHLPFEVRISGFSGERMELNCAEGGVIHLKSNNFGNSQFFIGTGSVLNIEKNNRLDSLSLTTGKGGHINLQGATVERLTSSIHSESSLTVSGMEIK